MACSLGVSSAILCFVDWTYCLVALQVVDITVPLDEVINLPVGFCHLFSVAFTQYPSADELEEFVVKSDEFENKPVESGKSDKSVLLIECHKFCKLGVPVGTCNRRQQGLFSSLHFCKI